MGGEQGAKALIGDFGISEGALFDALTGRVKPVGRLSFELPSSMTDLGGAIIRRAPRQQVAALPDR